MTDRSSSFIGSEITAIAAAETASPRRAVPTAIKGVWIRLVLFYVISAFIIGLLVSPSDPSLNLGSTAAKSPFVIAIKNAGIPTLPSIINAVLLSSAWSSGCASLYISSRTLYGISTRGHAPVFLQKTRSDGLPWITVLIGALFGLLAFMASSPGSAGRVFGYCESLLHVMLVKTSTHISSRRHGRYLWYDFLERYLLDLPEVAQGIASAEHRQVNIGLPGSLATLPQLLWPSHLLVGHGLRRLHSVQYV